MCGCRGDVHGCQGACMVARGGAWLLGGMRGCWGACVLLGGVHGEGGHVWQKGAVCGEGGHVWQRGACVAKGGHAWQRGGSVAKWGGGACVGYDEIRSMSRRYASYWNAFLLILYCIKHDGYMQGIPYL